MSDKPAGEWTAKQWQEKDSWDIMEGDKLVVGDLMFTEQRDIIAAHKAALDAAQERVTQAWLKAENDTIQQLRDQLTAERELSRQAIDLLSNQLTAEQEKLADRHKLCVDYEMKWKAEQEKSRILGNMIDGVSGQPGFREQLAALRETHED